jgi:hypothetical protein
MNKTDDLFKDYGVEDPSIMEAIENLASAFMLKGLRAPVRIVLDRHGYDRFQEELRVQENSGKKVQLPQGVVIAEKIHTSGGKIDIVQE